MSGAKKKVNYDLIEPGWRAGIKSPALLAAEYTEATGQPVSRVAIIKHFEKLNVPRDLRAKIHAKAESLVAAAAVTGLVAGETKATETAIVERNGRDVALVALAHRGDIRRGRELVAQLLDELRGLSDRPDLIEELQDALAAGGEDEDPDEAKKRRDRLREALQRVMALPSRVASVKGLAEALRHLVGLEREAWGMDKPEAKPPAPPPSLADIPPGAEIDAYKAWIQG